MFVGSTNKSFFLRKYIYYSNNSIEFHTFTLLKLNSQITMTTKNPYSRQILLVIHENLVRRHHLIIKYKFKILLATKLKAGQK